MTKAQRRQISNSKAMSAYITALEKAAPKKTAAEKANYLRLKASKAKNKTAYATRSYNPKAPLAR